MTSKSEISMTVHVAKGPPGRGEPRVLGACGTLFGTPTGNGIVSWNDASTFKVNGAVDFACSTPLTINQVDVQGYYFGSGTSAPFQVTVYDNNAGTNEPLTSNVVCASQPATGTVGSGLTQSTLALGVPCAVQAGTTYWLEVIGTDPFNPWYWATQTTTSGLYDADWRDVTGAFGGGPCTPGYVDSTYMQTCVYGGPVGEPDFMFELTGTAALPPAPCNTVNQMSTQFATNFTANSFARTPRPEGADDFICNGPVGSPLEVLHVGWKGKCLNYNFPNRCPPQAFIIRIYDDDPTGGTSEPGNLICGRTVSYTTGWNGPLLAPVGRYQQTNAGWPPVTSGALRIYEATLPSLPACQLANGVKYWIAIVGAKPNPPAVWQWQLGAGTPVLAPADWRQPPGGPCPTWNTGTYLQQCVPGIPSGVQNLLFRIN